MKSKKIFLIVFICISIGINFIFYIVDLHPLIIDKIFTNKYMNEVDVSTYKEKVVCSSLMMANNNQVYMQVKEQSSFYQELSKILSSEKKRVENQFYYPKAFLLVGITDYLKSSGDSLINKKILGIMDKYISKNGELNFNLEYVDQVPFGIAFINLYQVYHDERFKRAADKIFLYITMSVNQKDSLIYYRSNSNILLVDALGMVCPFLIRYGVTFNNSVALKIAYTQILFYIKYGLEENSRLPFHAIHISKKLRLGPANWGRGIGWYLLALSFAIHYTDNNSNAYYKIMNKEIIYLYDELMNLSINSYWGQFITGNPMDKIDTSTTTMFLYSFQLVKEKNYKKAFIVDLFKKYTTTEGFLDFTSGDTYNVNNYSHKMCKSELSQGMLLSILSLSI